MTATNPAGIWLPLITPFRDGALDAASLRNLARHYAGQPIDGLILAATTGEALTLDDDEQHRVVQIVAEANDGRLPLYLGLAGSDTRRMARRLAETDRWPVQGYLISCPYYSRPSQGGLLQHFQALAAATQKPLMLYNIPYRAGVNLANDTLFRLAETANIVGLKDCCADPAQMADLLRRKPPGLAVLTGDDAQTFSALTQGAEGAILAAAHIDPVGFRRLFDALRQGELAAARQIWGKLSEIIALLFAEPGPAPTKHWLWRAGLIASPELRLPMTGVSPALAARLDQALAKLAKLD
jgi:4-hydroxy-tetrahydrodipicolinate synthase